MTSLSRHLFLLGAVLAGVLAVALWAAGPAAAQEGPSCPADIDGQVLGSELPGTGDTQGLRCRYEPADNRSLVRLTARYNAPGDEPTLANGCGGAGRRTVDEEENEITGIVLSSVGMARVSWEIGNTNRDFNEEAVLAAAEDFLATFEDLAIPCPDAGPDAGEAEECLDEFDGLTAELRASITNRDDVAGVRCFYAGTDTRSEVQFIGSLNPPGAEPTFASGCGAEARQAEDEGALVGTVFSAVTMTRVSYEVVDTSLEFDADLVAAEAAALLSRLEDQGQLCEGAAPITTAPTTTLAPPTTEPESTSTAPPTTDAPDTTEVTDTAATDTTAVAAIDDGGADDGGSGLLVPLIVGSLVVAGGAGAFVLWRRSQLASAAAGTAAAPAPAPPAPRRPPADGDPGDTITGAPPPPE